SVTAPPALLLKTPAPPTVASVWTLKLPPDWFWKLDAPETLNDPEPVQVNVPAFVVAPEAVLSAAPLTFTTPVEATARLKIVPPVQATMPWHVSATLKGRIVPPLTARTPVAPTALAACVPGVKEASERVCVPLDPPSVRLLTVALTSSVTV